MATKMTFLYMRAVGLCAVALAFWLVIGSDARVLHQTCGATHPSVGFTADMVEISHDLRGTFTVVDDCTFKIENFSYDGTGPAVYWWGNTDASPSQLRYGKMVVDEKVPAGGGSGTTVSLWVMVMFASS
mmetsp:Transcript_17626/g.45871  ORF Transcript_17626/g.45871 Transcript_17626/m.45871 type:complete len:129 (+) Transcript_17626:130-516(+)